MRNTAGLRFGPGHAAFVERIAKERRASAIRRALDSSRACSYPIYDPGGVEQSCREKRVMVTFRESGIAVLSCERHAGIGGPQVRMPRAVRS